jgi:hypothetical protein
MHDYKLYYLDEAGHIVQAVVLNADDDEAAVAEAESRRDQRRMELWRRARLVRELPALNAETA